ncbi:MAG: 30S ribosomal protein S5 [Candidatus Portnoybacteria bacterium RIFCSPLOWO2_12_FULL_39_9]|uniref:Small ribosomal subunit protein uS5 n=1 Tax=Candidatus Portnoybacteria bacterium RIFCSPHIGHO2_12_FULL_38_9 TaxID=1801997 RepID=A0A1G2FHL0_9BACT|nr:MAG: 30S ribosomal protein S5 [Candidatus Portnoybacteria bacterium RBG_13_40_8]OGZ36126.1 MAG: 30S ribosomal protein S5 [Candidatus Portnoybacteria bacterium RIFCSPHIGHO2_02_FULL_39_12]OGZ37272.1 MAG: 30S ribosomal protein S5 [Candidatus Portnoybacteria bacterium RIFCSPHIGHO2_12_FULL_38_9]OGZ40664.1 MAG: 30S ribosomal protein S5 [Candidatus Portnoybacteria bacterium RIFCSPLOWO2_12_FULL_39_9]
MISQTQEKTEYESKLLDVARVTRVVAGGRRFRFRATVVVGNRRGKVGVGVAKGQDVSLAVEKATADAKKRLVKISLLEGGISHSTSAKYGSSKVLLKPGAKGRGLVAGGAVRTVCDLAGIKNISAKILGRTKNKLNNARATIEALTKLKTPILKK